MADPESPDCVAAVRRFNRYYTRRIGLLGEGLLGGPLTLSEARLVYELAQRGTATATELGADLDLDSGYMSRLLRGLAARRLVSKRRCDDDGRQVLLSLTPSGRRVFAAIDARSREQVGAMIERLSGAERRQLVDALATTQRLLDGGQPRAPAVPYVLRPPRPGDMGWIVHRHGALYAEEYGWDETFEALVAEIVAGFVRSFDPRRERCWIAEREGAVAGSVFLVRESERVGKLRLLYVEPGARGLGIGRRLVDECIRQARHFGYSRLTLWTNDVLVSARRIYEAAGFRLIAQERHHSFGHDLVGQNWDLEL
jgi:DNA-binding MarR family transcriptional regulator/RimJ/RimL family protein N-acetyltransferase